MLMIRFQRIGRKNDPAFRIVVLEKTAGPKAGKYVALVGTYNPKTKVTNVQGENIKAWVAKGAQISPSVMNLLIKNGIYDGKKFAVVSKKNLEKNQKNEVANAVTEEVKEEIPAAVEEVPAVEEKIPAPAEEAPTAEAATADEELEAVA
ncbi:30S ribosomal protein S16 [Patescibacteria group bacterium]|nr:30S ribosomal protein S16 [Patescibacteria group bacterium]